jgi:outer membrane autotransporter protein
MDPMAAIFVIDNLAVGAALGFSSSNYKEDDDYKNVVTEVTIEPMVRYYLPQNVFFQGRAIFGNETDKEVDDGITDKLKYSVSGFSLGVGYAYFLGENVAVEPLVGYASKGYKNKDSEVKFVEGGVFIRIGFQIYLRK